MTIAPTLYQPMLRDYCRQCRISLPLPNRDDLDDVDQHCCDIARSAIAQWLKKHGQRFLHRRRTMSRILGISPDPVIIFTSNIPGLIAARELLDSAPGNIFSLLDEEYLNRPIILFDSKFQYHVRFWASVNKDIEEEIMVEFKKTWSNLPDDELLQLSEGTQWAANACQGTESVWRMNGKGTELIAEGIVQWGS